jgi:hypothetical protein
MSRKLALADIADARAYERERGEFRAHVIAVKACRRVSVGPVITFVFENRDTVRFQIQEMARVERILDDAGIQEELDIYNPLIPEPGELSATMFVELTSDAEVREWLPRLVGVERSVSIALSNGSRVHGVVDPRHASQLTREHVTAAVHYVSFAFDQEQIKAFTLGAGLAIQHPAYEFEVMLGSDVVTALLTDLVV